MKQAVILAAGVGSRLASASDGGPKCLVPVGERPLIEHQLDVLHGAGVTSVCVVVGHRQGDIRSRVNHGCQFIENHRFAETNSLYSLWQVRDWIRGSFVLLNCDVLAHPDIYHRVMAVNGTALAYDSASGDEAEHMKVQVKDGHVTAMSKTLEPERTHGENVGILQFDASAVEPLFDEIERLVSQGGDGHWAPAAVAQLAQRLAVRAVDIADLPWTEIDFPEDLKTAERDVWPLIRAGRRVLPTVNGNGDGTPNGNGNGDGKSRPGYTAVIR
jgi:choline kinase